MQPNKKISKKTLIYHMITFLVVVYFFVMLVYFTSVTHIFHINYFSFDAFVLGTIIFFIAFFIFCLMHHIRATYNKAKNKLFTSEMGNTLLMSFFRPSYVQNGIFVGVKLDTYLKKINKNEWSEKLIQYIYSQKFGAENPIILRSHLLSSTRMRKYLVDSIEKNGGHCLVRVDLPINAKFMLLWLTPAIQGVFQLYIPAFREYEAEIIITSIGGKVID